MGKLNKCKLKEDMMKKRHAQNCDASKKSKSIMHFEKHGKVVVHLSYIKQCA